MQINKLISTEDCDDYDEESEECLDKIDKEHDPEVIQEVMEWLSRFFEEELTEKELDSPATDPEYEPIDPISLIEGMHHEMANCGSEEEAQDVAKVYLSIDPLYYVNGLTFGQPDPATADDAEPILVTQSIEKICVPISKADKMKQIVYCVVLSPDEVDAQDDWMPADEIEKTAHNYMEKYRVIGSNHENPIAAVPVESYIAPVDFEMDGGQYGAQKVTKGSWVIGIKIKDPKEWEKVVSGEYQGVSVGGLGVREAS